MDAGISSLAIDKQFYNSNFNVKREKLHFSKVSFYTDSSNDWFQAEIANFYYRPIKSHDMLDIHSEMELEVNMVENSKDNKDYTCVSCQAGNGRNHQVSVSSKKMVMDQENQSSILKFNQMLESEKKKSIEKLPTYMSVCKIGQLHDPNYLCQQAPTYKNSTDFYKNDDYFSHEIQTTSYREKSSHVVIEDIGGRPDANSGETCPIGIISQAQSDNFETVYGMSYFFENVHQIKNELLHLKNLLFSDTYLFYNKTFL